MIHSLRAVFIILLLAMQVLLGATADAGTKVHTPPPGSAERRMLLELMRRKVMELSRLDVVFVVKEMNVSRGWAWVRTYPQSKDGAGRYEDFIAILQKKNGRWRIAEIPCTEPDNTDCLDSRNYVSHLRRRFPDMPAAILPSEMVKKQGNPFAGPGKEKGGSW